MGCNVLYGILYVPNSDYTTIQIVEEQPVWPNGLALCMAFIQTSQ